MALRTHAQLRVPPLGPGPTPRVGAIACGLAALGLMVALGAGAATPARKPPPPTPQAAVMAPLAEKSLLLAAAWAGDRLVAVGDRGHILLSDDAHTAWTNGNGDAHWRQAPVPVRAALTAVTFIDARQGWAVGHDAVIVHTTDGGESWGVQNLHPEWEQPLMAVRFADADHGIAVGAYGLFLETSDGGKTWTQRKIMDEDTHLNALFALPTAPGTSPSTAPSTAPLVIAGEAGTVLISPDGGQTWRKTPTPYEGSFFGGVALGADSFIVYGLQGHALRTDDGGRTWTTLETGTKAGLMGGTRKADGAVVLVGALGALLTSGPDARAFTLSYRPDRVAQAGAVDLGPAGLLLLGAEGIKHVPGGPGSGSGGG